MQPMFDRNRVDNIPEQTAVPVEIAFADGTAAKGKMLVPVGRSVADALNGTGSFVEFEPYGGDKSYLAKAQLASVRLVGVPKAPNLQARLLDVDGFDPHRILGLSAAVKSGRTTLIGARIDASGYVAQFNALREL